MTGKVDKAIQALPSELYVSLIESFGRMAENEDGEVMSDDPEITFNLRKEQKDQEDVNEKSKFLLNWNVVKERSKVKEEDNETDELAAFASVFLARGQSEIDIQRVGTCNGTSGTEDLLE